LIPPDVTPILMPSEVVYVGQHLQSVWLQTRH